ncbi:MAG: DUF58 domain-containing protein [Elusimicrobia bacterium]|nr:DUF58 domain-containing protein [Elusimicrobiota bacterium]
MLPKEVIQKIRRIEIKTSRLVTDIFAGQYQSVFKGRGMEFDEVREYQPGDEIRSIDWNVTARMGHPFVKKFVEERQLTVLLLLDVSGSSYFGSGRQLKRELAAELCGVLAFSALKNNDRVGLLIFSDRIESFITPRKGLRHVLRVVREALYTKPQGKETDIKMALEYLNRVIRKRAVCFLISDFINADCKRELKIARQHHDLIAVTITDPRETELPNAGIIRIEDAETNQTAYLDTSDKKVREEFFSNSQRWLEERIRMIRKAGVDNIDIRTDQPYTEAIIRFFRAREKRLRF